MSLLLLLLSGCYKDINSFTPDRDKNLLLREWEQNGREQIWYITMAFSSKSKLYTTNDYFSIFLLFLTLLLTLTRFAQV